MIQSIEQGRGRTNLERSLVGFVVADIHYAVPIDCVREIISPVPMTGLPLAPPSVAGVADHRGNVVTLVDLRRHLGRPPTDATSKSKWILIKAENVSLGLIVDGVTGVFGVADEFVRQPPPVAGEAERGFLGVIAHGGRITYVLDVGRFHELAEATGVARQREKRV